MNRAQHLDLQESNAGVMNALKTKIHKAKRDIAESSDWETICPSVLETRHPYFIDNEGNRIFQLAVSGNEEYQELLSVKYCQNTADFVGGVALQCEQEYLEHILVVVDLNTGQEKIHKLLYPSGCSAKKLKSM